MPSRLAGYADRVIEASWLLIAFLVPLFFNVFSARVFEPDKLTLFRVLMLLAIGAWVVREFEFGSTGGSVFERWKTSLKQNPLAAPALVLASSYLLSTILSVAPQVSFFGSYQRLQGTLNNWLYITLFFLVFAGLRNWGGWIA